MKVVVGMAVVVPLISRCVSKKKSFFYLVGMCGRGGESARVRGVWFGVFLAFEESFGD